MFPKKMFQAKIPPPKKAARMAAIFLVIVERLSLLNKWSAITITMQPWWRIYTLFELSLASTLDCEESEEKELRSSQSRNLLDI